MPTETKNTWKYQVWNSVRKLLFWDMSLRHWVRDLDAENDRNPSIFKDVSDVRTLVDLKKSKSRGPLTQWRSIIAQKKKDSSHTSTKNLKTHIKIHPHTHTHTYTHTHRVELGYNNIGLCNSLSVASTFLILINSSLLTTTLCSLVIITIVYNVTKYSVSFMML
jgi:hypothetical protein